MAQKFHRARKAMADKETLEVCFAIDSDEDRDVVAEVDNTEGRTSEDEVPPQVCKNTANKRHVTMEAPLKTAKRTTAFNAFCSEKLKENPHAGFQSEEWGRQWRSLPEDAKKEFETKAFTLRNKSLDVKAVLKNITTMISVLRQNQEEAKAAGVDSMCTVVYKNGSLFCTGFGCLGDLLNDQSIHQRMMTFVNTTSNSVKETIKTLREKVALKMSKIAKSQLGLTQFPYERAKKGDFLVTGVPPCLLPLQPPAKLATKELLELLRSELSVIRMPRITQKTNIPSQTDRENYTQNETNVIKITAPQIENITQQTEKYVQNLETRAENAIQHISDMQQNTTQHVGTTEDSTDYALNIRPAEKQDAGNATVNLLPREPHRQDLGDQHQLSGSGDLPKAKRTRVTWDADSTKALEDSLGPLEALTCIPSAEEIKNIRLSKPVLHKFDVSQIYKKLYKIKSKKK